MKLKQLTSIALVGAMLFSSCEKGDIENLQSQIDDLNAKVDELEQSQEEALLTSITQLETAISTMSTSNATQYTELLAGLQKIEGEVLNNASSVYYGNLLTDADYDSLVEQGAQIITGKVMVYNANHLDALADVKMIGGSLSIIGSESVALNNLQAIGDDLNISGVSADATVEFGSLASVGGHFLVENNPGLTAVTADNLVLIDEELHLEKNLSLESLSLAKLDMAGEVNIYEYYENDPSYLGFGALNQLNLSTTDVEGDVNIQFVKAEEVSIGEIEGSFTIKSTYLNTLELTTTKINGDFVLENSPLSSISVDNLEKIEGMLTIRSLTDGSYNFSGATIGLETMPSFDALTYVGGDITIEANAMLLTMEAFNNVTEIKSSRISINGNADMEYISIFNNLVTAGPSNWTYTDIFITQTAKWFDSFNKLPKIKDLSLTISKPLDFGGGIGFGAGVSAVATETETVQIEGFDALTEVNTLYLTATDATTFTAFPALSTFKSWNGTYLTVVMPSDANVGMCSMEPIFTKITNGDFDNEFDATKKAFFQLNWAEQDRDVAVAQLLSTCND